MEAKPLITSNKHMSVIMTHLAKRQRDQKLWECLVRDLERQHKGSSRELSQERKKSTGGLNKSQTRGLYHTYMGRNESNRDQSKKRLPSDSKLRKLPVDVR